MTKISHFFLLKTKLVPYVVGVFIGIIGGTPDKRISEGLTFFDKVCVLNFAHQNRVRSMFFEFL